VNPPTPSKDPSISVEIAIPTPNSLCKFFKFINHIQRPIDVTIPHSEDTVKITFGTTLTKHSCIASFGIDDVMIFVK